METRGQGVLQDEVVAGKMKEARRLVAEKVPDALHQLLERQGVEYGEERNSSSLEYAGSCRDAREYLF